MSAGVMENIGRLLLFLGGGLVLLELLFTLLGKVPGIGRLPGDIGFRRGNFTHYLQLVTSLFLTVIVNLVLRLFRG